MIVIKFKFFIKSIVTCFILIFAFTCTPVSLAGKDDENIKPSSSSVEKGELKRAASSVITKPDFLPAENSMKRADTQMDICNYDQRPSAKPIKLDFQYGRQRNRIIKLAFNDFCEFLKEISC